MQPDPTVLDALADRVERGEETTELNKAVALAVGWHRVEPRHGGGMRGGWIAPEDFRGVREDGAPIRDSLHGTDVHRDPPRFLWSLDAIEAARVRLLPGSEYQQTIDYYDGEFRVRLQKITFAEYALFEGDATTERHARLAALLRAVAAKVRADG